MQPNNSNNNDNISSASRTSFFETFFQEWLVRQQNYLDQLKSTLANVQNIPERELNTLVTQVLAHYQEYYAAKSIVTRDDDNSFMMFSPPWFSSFERTFLWIAGFKPGLAFKLVKNSVRDLSDVQLERVDWLMVETRAAERELNEEMGTVQESLVGPRVVELVRRTPGRRLDGESRDVDEVIEALRDAMEALVENADLLRMTTAKKVVDILNPVQALQFLAAATQLQLKIRTWGWRREAAVRGGGGPPS